MPDRDHDLVTRLDALGARAAADTPPMPGALVAAVGARKTQPAARAPLPALAAAAAVVLAGAALVVFRMPVVSRGVATGAGGPLTLMAMMERFNRNGSLDAALGAGPSGAAVSSMPTLRAIDARSGLLPE